MRSARSARPGFSPLDDELALLPGSLTPRLHEALVRLSITQRSFAKATAELAFFTGASVHPDTARRRSEAAGALLLNEETAQAERILNEHPASPPGPDTLVFSVDGAMVPLVGGQWKETRTLAVGAVQPPKVGKDGVMIQTSEVSYFSRLSDSTTFAELALVELHRRGIERAGRVGAVVDGAVWCQSFIDYHYAEAVRILDLPHAAQYLSAIGQTPGSDGPLLSEQALKQLRDELKERGPEGVLSKLRALVAAHPERAELGTALAYLEQRVAQMDYPRFVAEGWPIGSGMVESANKLEVEERMKGAGKHWEERNVNPMLTLCNALGNERWVERWEVIEQAQRQQLLVQRRERRERRRVGQAEAVAVEVVRAALPVRATPVAAVVAPPTPVEAAPKSVHPWKRAWSVRRQRELADAA
jgi:hypothetical protein